MDRFACKVEPDRGSMRAFGTWYRAAHQYLLDLYGLDAGLFAGILAATSPRVAVSKNWQLAVKAYGQYRSHKCFYDKAGYMPCHIPNVQRALIGQALSGDKVSRFARNLQGDLTCVTVDVWIAAAYGLEHKELTRTVYADLEKQIQAEATAWDLPAAEYQAVIWHVYRRFQGRADRSFSSVSRNCQKFLFAV